MEPAMTNPRTITISAGLLLMLAAPVSAQLNQTFRQMFNQFLRQDLFSSDPSSTFFDDSALLAENELRPVLNNLISSNISAFPLPSTIAGLTFELLEGRPEIKRESLGPIYAETAETVGQLNLNIGFNASHYSLSDFRGLPVENLSFRFFTDDLNGDGILGGADLVGRFFETETMEIFPDLSLDANSVVVFATLGITNNLDVGFALPFTRVRMAGTARAVLSGTTFHLSGLSNYSFSKSASDIDFFNPNLEDTFEYDNSASGIGDISVRLKYRFLTGPQLSLAVLADIRLATGAQEDFLSTGKTDVSLLWIVSRTMGNFAPHVNFGYRYKGADFDSDEVGFVAGFDHKLSRDFTFVLDFLGNYDRESGKLVLLPDTQAITFSSSENAAFTRQFHLSNVPNASYDNTLDIATGLKFAPTDNFLIMANIILPLQNGGLRSQVVPMVGAALTFD